MSCASEEITARDAFQIGIVAAGGIFHPLEAGMENISDYSVAVAEPGIGEFADALSALATCWAGEGRQPDSEIIRREVDNVRRELDQLKGQLDALKAEAAELNIGAGGAGNTPGVVETHGGGV